MYDYWIRLLGIYFEKKYIIGLSGVDFQFNAMQQYFEFGKTKCITVFEISLLCSPRLHLLDLKVQWNQ